MKKYPLLLMLLMVAAVFTGCSKDDDTSGNSEGMANVAILLTDAPGDYEEVWVEIEEVMIKTSVEGPDEEGWETLEDFTPTTVNLLDLTGGVTELLVDTELPAGFLHQIRLVLGDNNEIIVEREGPDGPVMETHVLKTPSAQQSGLKIMIDEDLEADTQYTFILDFDVDKSVVNTGNGGYNLKPVIRGSLLENTSGIEGLVVGTEERVLVTAKGPAAEVSAYTNEEGEFLLHGIPAGTYLITVTPPADSGFEVYQDNNVTVEEDEVLDLGEIVLQESQE